MYSRYSMFLLLLVIYSKSTMIFLLLSVFEKATDDYINLFLKNYKSIFFPNLFLLFLMIKICWRKSTEFIIIFNRKYKIEYSYTICWSLVLLPVYSYVYGSIFCLWCQHFFLDLFTMVHFRIAYVKYWMKRIFKCNI